MCDIDQEYRTFIFGDGCNASRQYSDEHRTIFMIRAAREFIADMFKPGAGNDELENAHSLIQFIAANSAIVNWGRGRDTTIDGLMRDRIGVDEDTYWKGEPATPTEARDWLLAMIDVLHERQYGALVHISTPA